MSENDSKDPGLWALTLATKDGPQRQAAPEPKPAPEDDFDQIWGA